MPSASKIKGSRWEAAVARFLSGALGRSVDRDRGQAGRHDEGDILGVDLFAFQLKHYDRPPSMAALAKIMDQADAQRVNAGKPFSAVVIPRPGSEEVSQAIVALPLADLAMVLALLHHLTESGDTDESN